MDSILFISDIFKQKNCVLVKVEFIFINTCKDCVNKSDASLRQYIFLQIGVNSMLKYPLQAPKTRLNAARSGLFTFKQKR